MPYAVGQGINAFLAGFITSENFQFRDYELNFKMSNEKQNIIEK